MYTRQAYQQYRTVQAQTADKGELVVMLYQGAIKFLARAAVALGNRDMEGAHENIVRCQDIIAELMGSLDMSTGDMASNLYRVYEYMHYRLVQANVHKDSKPIEEVTQLLRELLPAWQNVATTARLEDKSKGMPSGSSMRYVAV